MVKVGLEWIGLDVCVEGLVDESCDLIVAPPPLTLAAPGGGEEGRGIPFPWGRV